MVTDETVSFNLERERNEETKEILKQVYDALQEKGYNPINQIVGYILSGDPTYITSHKGARNLIRNIERDELLEKLVKSYINLSKNFGKPGVFALGLIFLPIVFWGILAFDSSVYVPIMTPENSDFA